MALGPINIGIDIWKEEAQKCWKVSFKCLFPRRVEIRSGSGHGVRGAVVCSIVSLSGTSALVKDRSKSKGQALPTAIVNEGGSDITLSN